MKVNYIFFILIFFVLQNCGYTPMYSNLKSQNYQMNIIDIKGNDEMNKIVNLQINNYSNKTSKKIIELKVKTFYEKDILSKDKKGKATNYLISTRIDFEVNNFSENNKFTYNEKTKIKNIDDKFELNSYEDAIKNNFISSSIKNFLLRVETIK